MLADEASCMFGAGEGVALLWDGELVGGAGFYDTGTMLTLHDLVTCGIVGAASMLFLAVIKEARKRGYAEIRARVEPDSPFLDHKWKGRTTLESLIYRVRVKRCAS